MSEVTGTADGESGLLVFGDDGSAAADVAWLWVSNHRWPGWRAEVVTATQPPFPPPSWDSYATPVEWESPHRRLLFAESALTSVRHLTTCADPRLVLGDRRDASVLVVGASGVGRLKAFLVGSTTEWLLHHPPAPLAVVRSADPARRVLVCVDGSVHAQRAVEVFAGLPWAGDTDVTVLGVYDGWADVEEGHGLALASLAAASIPASVLEVRGKATHTILEQVAELQAQLVVLGTRGLTGWRRLRLGSTASAVIRAAPCSSLVACVDETSGARDAGD